MQRQIHNGLRSRAGRTLSAVTAALLLLLISFLATDAEAHAALHDDAHLPGHECVITLVAQGQLTGPSAPVAVLDAPDRLCVAFLHSPAPVFPIPSVLLPPSCGPPAAV